MLKKGLWLLVCCSAVLSGAEKNLIMNGDFEMKGKSFPPFWMFRSHTPSLVDAFPEGGPGGRGYLRVEGKRALVTVQQNNITLKAGAVYRLSAYVRTSNLKGRKSGVLVHPGSGDGLVNLPENTNGSWQYAEGQAVLPAELKGPCKVSVQVDEAGGVLEISGLKLVAPDDETERVSKTQIENMTPSMVPLFLLKRIDLNHLEKEFFWVGALPGKKEDLECVFSMNGKMLKLPFLTRKMRVDFASLSPEAGENTLVLQLQNRISGGKVFRQEYAVCFRKLPALKQGKRLNNFVTVLYEGELPQGGSVEFDHPKDGWVLFRETGAFAGLTLDGKTLLTPDNPRQCAVRLLPAGRYTLRNLSAAASVSVRAIPDIHIFPLGSSSFPGNGAYDWEFVKKHMIPALTTINVSGLTAAQKKEVALYGAQYLSNFGVLNPDKPNDGEDLLKRMENFRDLHNPLYDGTTMDEVEYWDAPAINPYVWALKHFKNPQNKTVSSWVIGPPSFSYADYISTACNISGGNGRILYEVYDRGQYTEEDARAYIRQTAQHAGFYRDIAPELFSNLSIILGNFSQAPRISLDQIPDTDFKYFLDMQMSALANDPLCNGLSGIGFWGCDNCDEEMLRWCFALLKHYAVEGYKDMLSARYGFRFKPGLVKNGDFEEGLAGWTVKGDVQTAESRDYGKNSEGRYGSDYALGDKFAVLSQQENASPEVRQKITALEPGKLYSVSYMVADYDDILTGINNPRRMPMTLEVAGGMIVRRSYFVDNRKRPKMKARVNACKYVFRAQGPEIELVFKTRNAKPGTRLALNYIQVRPYFAEEK